ncbi:hypothetical protein BS78_05G016000 [Paspalum vaginatum]|nr:hypothetical protein BS78_05G016000 [Paspalum vaginatum]KAJ1273842.1 hypothetical protein BS78_05G016000 [Paspalum vaginatum]KAJ1273844.1 hypothetical protein BS78_05G016000 [Paspalum vaginatum]KAJ1273845.1 hypothetical protein BS78_05G016000 [Paspalum vaginatum]
MEQELVSFQFLQDITDGFSRKRKLGEGAFGVVYKGVTKSGEKVAVKMLKVSADLDNQQFRNEFYNLRKLKHPNIVQILGYCYETEKIPSVMPDGNKVFVDKTYTALCFEYLCNGSLQNHLSDKDCELHLSWHKRFKIIKGTCEGLRYMHKDLEKHIYHLDLKLDNILLDKDMVPKIADFGLSMMFDKDLPHNTESRYGTPGYQPPEHIDTGEITEKFDIFSLGVVMIRIVSGLEGYPRCQSMSPYEFVDQVKQSWRNRLQATCSGDLLLEAYCRQVERCTQIALDCVKSNSQKRPSIVEITKELNEIEAGICENPQKEMRKETKDIPETDLNIKLQTVPGYSDLDVVDGREISSDVAEELIVGRTEEKKEIMTSLLEGMPKRIAILPIYGIGGIGKTTFARLIYNDPKFNGYSRVWVDVFQRFDLHKIYNSIISQLSKKERCANERQMIHSCLKNLLSGKKIIIVLDDIWEDDPFQLKELKDMIYHDDSNIIILVTTRSECIAKRICINHQPYKILPLPSEMCWDIIKQRCGFEDRNDKEQLMDIGQEIAKQCGGVALAAQSLGFTLRSKDFDEWMKVKDSDIWNEPVSKDFSLPNHVLASLKEICEKYIVQLLGLCFLQQSISPKSSEEYYTQLPFFTMHDLVHDLAVSLIGNQILDQSQQGNTGGSSCQYALLSDYSKPLEFCLTSQARLVALRFLDGCRRIQVSGAAFTYVRSLRVLDLSECSIWRLPDSIGQLKQLTYLNSPGIQDDMVPKCIRNLSNLVYLNLHGSRIRRLPESIGEMGILMHLDLSACSLSELPVSFWNLERLVYLDLSGCRGISSVSQRLQNLNRLEHLNLSWCRNISCLQKAMSAFTELQYLNLTHVSCFGLQEVLAKLTKLRYLNLYGSLNGRVAEAGLDSILECASSLSNLEYLNLGGNHHVCTLPETIGNLSNLNTLDLSNCSNLQRLPPSLSAINSLKFLNVSGCSSLDKATLPQNKNNSACLLPHFVVHAGDGESSSNLPELEDKHPTLLEISRLENVNSAEEAKRIKLEEKQSIKELELVWTRDAKRYVDDLEVLTRLQPPDTLERLRLHGYSSISFPFWMMSIATYLPHLEEIVLEDLPSCTVLPPPLGQLPNLERLHIHGMGSIRKIDGDLYGGRRAFPRLKRFYISDMECLKEWNAAYNIDEDGSNELAFPELRRMDINRCPSLRFKACPPPGQLLFINTSDQVLLSSWENRGRRHVSAGTGTTGLWVKCCEAPLHQWSLLRLLPCLTDLRITDCSDLTCSSTDLLRCLSSLDTLIVEGGDRENALVALPERLGDLTSLEELRILNCNAIKALPDSIQQLSCLQRLQIKDCKGIMALPQRLGDLTALEELSILNCKGIKALPDSIQQLRFLDHLEIHDCNGIMALPERLGDLTSLEELRILNCKGIKALPDSIQQLRFLKHLEIHDCPGLARWCKPKENRMKIDHIPNKKEA